MEESRTCARPKLSLLSVMKTRRPPEMFVRLIFNDKRLIKQYAEGEEQQNNFSPEAEASSNTRTRLSLSSDVLCALFEW